MVSLDQGIERDLVLRLLSGRWTQADYKRYLKTDHWERVKDAALSHWGASCCLCDAKTGLHIHHRPNGYKNLFREQPARHLTVLCTRCHRRHHRKG